MLSISFNKKIFHTFPINTKFQLDINQQSDIWLILRTQGYSLGKDSHKIQSHKNLIF